MNALKIIEKYYPQDNLLRRTLLIHSRLVAQKSLKVAADHPELNLNTVFLEEAALLHDVGIFLTHAPGIGCMGDEPYLLHGFLGAELLRKEGLPQHARVCERHTGTGLTAVQIEREGLPLPPGDYVPETQEEQVICYADKFFSKTHPEVEKTVEQARRSLIKFGEDVVKRFDEWHVRFGTPVK
ncbi:MAG: HDIG domain-containing protein [Clostridium sp.]|nr:HDIG domain-containing protein [Clostridium sp.]